MTGEAKIVLPNHELPPCRQPNGLYKKVHVSEEAAESFLQANQERYGSKPQYAYKCDLGGDELPQPHWHLATKKADEPRPEPTLEPDEPAIPLSHEDFWPNSGRATGSTVGSVEARRQRVLAALTDETRTYPQLASDLGMTLGMFQSDVQALRNEGLFSGRYTQSSFVSKPPTLTAAQQLAALEEVEKQMAAKKELLRAAVQAEEAARIEREKVHVDWVVEYPNKEIQVRKNATAVHFSVDAWREIIKTVSEEVGRFERDEIKFPVLENPVNGMIISGPRAGQIHEDYRRR